jgi:hypothetical protein
MIDGYHLGKYNFCASCQLTLSNPGVAHNDSGLTVRIFADQAIRDVSHRRLLNGDDPYQFNRQNSALKGPGYPTKLFYDYRVNSRHSCRTVYKLPLRNSGTLLGMLNRE